MSYKTIKERLGITDLSVIVTLISDYKKGKRDFSTYISKTHRTYIP